MTDQPRPTYAQRTFEDALAAIRDMRSSPTDRRDAAWILQHVARCEVSIDERLASDLMCAIHERLDEKLVVYYVLNALRRHCSDVAALTGGVMRLCARAHREGLPMSLRALIGHALEVLPWKRALDDRWVQDVITGRLLEGRTSVVATMLSQWLPGRGDVPDWVQAVLREHPAIMLDDEMSSFKRWRLHAAAPTAQGWRLLAACPEERGHFVAARFFEGTMKFALSTLEQAIEHEPEGATRVTLARWRVGLTGGDR